MTKAPDLHNYVEYRLAPGLWAVFWKGQHHSYHTTRKRANFALWRLKKIHKMTGAEPLPLSRLDRIIQEDWLENPQPSRASPKRSMRGLPCPDCGGTLYLRNGKFGLFYGCENYSKTLCRGSVSADRQGLPLGVPADAATRRARYLVRTAINHLFLKDPDNNPPYAVQNYTLEQCRAALAEMCEKDTELIEVIHNAPEHRHLTRLERLVSDRDPLDEMMGPIGVDLLES